MNNLSSIDPRFLYDAMKFEKNKFKNKLLNNKSDNIFNNMINFNKEIKKNQLKKVSEQMEALFINMMFKSMKKNLNKHRLIPENPAENIFNDMLYNEYSQQIAKSNKFGLAKMIYDQYSKFI